MSIEQSFERIADALEAQVLLNKQLLQHTMNPLITAGEDGTLLERKPYHAGQTPVDTIPCSAAAGKAAAQRPIAGIDDPLSGSKASNTPETDESKGDSSDAPAVVGWNPMTEAPMKRYPDQLKKDAIDMCINTLKIEIPASSNYVQKHNAILMHVNACDQIKSAAAINSDPMSYSTFQPAVLEQVKLRGKEAVIAATMMFTGQNLVNMEMCAGQYENILHELDPTKFAARDEGKTPPADNTSAADALQTGGTLQDVCDLARVLILEQGITPARIQDAIKDIAPGVTQVPVERIADALTALNALKKA
jgi:hypothetical protein